MLPYKINTALLLICLMLPLQACGLSGGSIEGKVLEEGTDKPIEGAIVVVRWSGALSAFVESRPVCVHVDTVTTDAQGRYRFSSWRKSWEGGVVTDLMPIVSA